MIRVKDLTYVYQTREEKKIVALEGIDLKIEEGGFFAFLGRNGSGKTTLARCLNGLLLPTRGMVLIDGMNTKNRNKLWKIREKVGLLFENPDDQLVGTTVEEDVAFGLENLKIKPQEIRRRVRESLKMVGMEEYSKYPPHLLSGGQRQKIALAGILTLRAKYLIFDCPTSFLDPKGKKEILEIVKRLKVQGSTVVYITHSMEEAMASDKIFILEKGKIVKSGPPREIFKDEMRDFGLGLPPVRELALSLGKEGMDIPGDVLTLDEMVNFLCS